MLIPLMEKREEVIANIRRSISENKLNAKVEVDDPQLSAEERQALVERFLEQRETASFRRKRRLARLILNLATRLINRHTRIEGIENLQNVRGGAIVTSNHFSPIDNTVVRLMARKAGKWRMPVVGQEANLAMPSLFGFMMRYADVIPISDNHRYLKGEFTDLLREEVDKGEFVLIYPEQEMWFNYRLPRPCKRGAYRFAAELGVPIVSCFVEIIDRDDLRQPNFVEVGYVMHVLEPIFPDPDKTVRENSFEMCQRDYQQKARAYEQIYGKALDYRFSPDDIAGWVPTESDFELLANNDGKQGGAPCPRSETPTIMTTQSA